MRTIRELQSVHQQIRACRACTAMCSPPVHGPALETSVMLVGQAPGAYESVRGRPFAHTSGTTLFKWLGQATGLEQEELREQIYIAAVARCYPGKSAKGAGDREPNIQEIENCRRHMAREVAILKPKIVLAVGRVAIAEVLGPKRFRKGTPLAEVVGRRLTAEFHGHTVDVIPLPHPSGVSRWTLTDPGKSCLKAALKLVARALTTPIPNP